MFVYALMCSTFDVENTSKIYKLFESLKNYKNCFNFRNSKTFFEHENENYILNLISNTKPSYEPLYTFSEIELDVLKNYLLKNLILNCIQKFMNCVNALIFFVFKQNNNFRLYIDYKELNALIIKNKCSVSLIDETLNCFVSAAYFIKLNFKNAYH